MLGEPSTDTQEVKDTDCACVDQGMPLQVVTVRSQYPNEKTCVLPTSLSLSSAIRTRNRGSWKYVSSLYLHASYSCNPKKHILQTNISNMSSSCLRKTNMTPFGYTSCSKPLTRQKTWMAITIKPYSNHSSVGFIQTQEVMPVFFTTQVTMFTPNLGTEWTA